MAETCNWHVLELTRRSQFDNHQLELVKIFRKSTLPALDMHILIQSMMAKPHSWQIQISAAGQYLSPRRHRTKDIIYNLLSIEVEEQNFATSIKQTTHQGKPLFTIQFVAFSKDLSILFSRRSAFNFLQHWLKLILLKNH